MLEVVDTDGSLKTLRQAIVAAVHEYSQHAVLIATPPDKSTFLFRYSPKVSATLHSFLAEPRATRLTDELEKLYTNFPNATNDHAYNVILLRMLIANFHLSSYEIMRLHIGDRDPKSDKDDWLVAYQLSMAEQAENEHRKTLGLDLLLTPEDEHNNRVFTERVLTETFPLFCYETFRE